MHTVVVDKMQISVVVIVLVVFATKKSYGYRNYVIRQMERNLNDLKNMKWCEGTGKGILTYVYFLQ